MKYIILAFALVFTISAHAQTARDYLAKGNSKISLKDLKGAIQDYDKTIELNPQYADAYFNRGMRNKIFLTIPQPFRITTRYWNLTRNIKRLILIGL